VRYHLSQCSDLAIKRESNNHHRVGYFKGAKPSGLWWATDNEWLDWCVINEPTTGGHIYALDIEESYLLKITTEEEFRRFDSWAKMCPAYPNAPSSVNWSLVAKRYHGIEITPFLPDCAHVFPLSWYTSWDVAGGVTWRPWEMVRGIEYVGPWNPKDGLLAK